jgi:SAM-dependent methyltransferase
MAEAWVVEPPSSVYDRVRARDAWTAFWQESGSGSQCLSTAPDIVQAQKRHWSAFADSLAPGARVLDLGCGAGAVARALMGARRDLQISGIDIARVPFVIDQQVDLLSDTAMESLPFTDASFAAVVSQFGFEYSQIDQAARELARVPAPGAGFSFLVHHAESSIVAASRAQLSAIVAFQAPETRAAFWSGNTAAFNAQLSMLRKTHPYDTLIAELARSLPSRMNRGERERAAIWKAIEEALAPERWVLEALNVCCVAPQDLDDWLHPLRRAFEVRPAQVLRKPTSEPIAWIIEGVRRPSVR